MPFRNFFATCAWRRCIPLLVMAAAALIRLPAMFSSRHLTFDDGVYGSSALAMRDGAIPFRDIFSPQGPLHLVLLRFFDILGMNSLNGPRLLTVTAGLAITAAVAIAAVAIGAKSSAWVVAALATTSGSLLWVTAPMTGDGPAIAWASAAVVATFAWSKKPSLGRAALIGLFAGAALATKLIVAPVGILIAGTLLIGRRPRHTIVASLSTMLVLFFLALPFGLERVYDQSVAYHNESERLESIPSQATKLLTTLLSRDLPLILFTVGGLVWVLSRKVRRLETIDWLLFGWLVAQVLTLILEKTMFRNHLATLVVPLALLAARFPLKRSFAIVLLVVLAPWWHSNNYPILHPEPAPAAEFDLIAALRRLPPNAQVISDEPGLVWRSGKRLPSWLVDASIKRIDDGQLSTDSISEFAASSEVCAFVQWSFRYGERLIGINESLIQLGYRPVARYTRWHGPNGSSGDRTLWLRDCVS